MNSPFDPTLIGCIGKEAYLTRAAAIDAQKVRLGRSKSRRNVHKEKRRAVTQLQTYRCEHCHDWHLGTRSNGEKMS